MRLDFFQLQDQTSEMKPAQPRLRYSPSFLREYKNCEVKKKILTERNLKLCTLFGSLRPKECSQVINSRHQGRILNEYSQLSHFREIRTIFCSRENVTEHAYFLLLLGSCFIHFERNINSEKSILHSFRQRSSVIASVQLFPQSYFLIYATVFIRTVYRYKFTTQIIFQLFFCFSLNLNLQRLILKNRVNPSRTIESSFCLEEHCTNIE